MSDAQADPLLGMTLHGTYVVEKLLGAGGMGAVYAARHTRLPKRFAIKVLHAQMAMNRDVFARFRREAEITGALGHQHIVEVVDFNQLDNGMPYLVMEFLSGEDLYARLQQRGRLALPEALEIARQVASALQAAHERGVVHRDLKPQNIFLVRQKELGREVDVVKVVDFGISKIRNPDVQTGPATTDGALLGTPSYMSPEQAAGRVQQIDGRTDQYALAAIIYEMLSGRVAFQPESGEGLTGVLVRVMTRPAPPLGQLCPELPQAVLAAIERAMSKDPAARFGSVTELLQSLEAGVGQPKAAQGAGSVAQGAGSVAQGAAQAVGGIGSGLSFSGGPSMLSGSPPPSLLQGSAPPSPFGTPQTPAPSPFGTPQTPALTPQTPALTPQTPALTPALTPQASLVPMDTFGTSIKPAADVSFGKWLVWGGVIGGGGLLLFLLLVLRLLGKH